ncbi:MAG: UvrB/UvrC motif-containing protein [Oscillospiraceae bacterium]|nr:UvrB/UvrC motif-containing protein [Oscillospiraceae bacterium]
MNCQNCGKRPATTQYKRIVNGQVSEQYLCESCVRELGLPGVFGGLNIGNFWGGLFNEPARNAAESVRCGGCGKNFAQIAESGKTGCAACYTTFYERLLPSIQRIHGKTRHVGKTPRGAGQEARRTMRIGQLKEQLARSIASQEYERCAELRDQIKSLEAEENAQGDNNREGGAGNE